MSDKSNDTVTIPALGRSFRLGMLYDCRKDMLIPGIPLLSREKLAEETHTTPKQHSTFKVIQTDSFADTVSVYSIDTALKLSVLSGLVDGPGSGNYLFNKNLSSHQQRVTLHYKCTTHTEELIHQFDKSPIHIPAVEATHVVISIDYGAFAQFIFESEALSYSTNRKFEGSLHCLVEKIPFTDIDVQGQVQISPEEKCVVKNFKCFFEGDFRIENPPSSYEDAVRTYKDLPKLLGENKENVVPVRVTLLPLVWFDIKSSKLVRHVREDLVQRVEEVFEGFHQINVKCNDICSSPTSEKFCTFKDTVWLFKQYVNSYTTSLKEKISKLLPDIRGGSKEESDLQKVLDDSKFSPFNLRNLNSWIEETETLEKILSKYITALPDVKIAKSHCELEQILLDPAISHTLCFTFLLPQTGAYLQEMADYVKSSRYNSKKDSTENQNQILRCSSRVSMKKKTQLFTTFYSCSTDEKINTETEDNEINMLFLIYSEASGCKNLEAEIRLYNNNELINSDYELPSKPGKPEVVAEKIPHNGITIQWTPPLQGVANVLKYELLYELDDRQENTSTKTVDAGNTQVTLPDLSSVYNVSVRALCKAGLGPRSDINPQVSTNQINEENLGSMITGQQICGDARQFPAGVKRSSDGEPKERKREEKSTFLKKLISVSEKLTNKGNLTLYKPKLHKIETGDHDPAIQKYEFGNSAIDMTEEKVIMFVGSTGSGKTTLINLLTNYIFGIEYEDSMRFKLITEDTSDDQTTSQTKTLTSYTIYHREGFKAPQTLTIIDTPGFGDRAGVRRDQEITSQIQQFFNTDGRAGIDHIDVVAFVVNSSQSRITPTLEYIFDNVLTMFGKDMQNNIYFLLTFADMEEPTVLNTIRRLEVVPVEDSFKFNSSCLHEGARNEISDKFWKMGVKSFELLMRKVMEVEPVTLSLTREVLKVRQNLKANIRKIKYMIRSKLNTLSTLEKEKEVIMKYGDKEYIPDYEVDIEWFEEEKLISGHRVLSCLACKRTCHPDCTDEVSAERHSCSEMTDGQCLICSSECSWEDHKFRSFRFVPRTKVVSKTGRELFERYREANREEIAPEDVVIKIQEQYQDIQATVLSVIKSTRTSLDRLTEIALKPYPVSLVEYIDTLINTEEANMKPGWRERLHQLQNIRREYQIMQEIADNEYDPFPRYETEITRKRKSEWLPWIAADKAVNCFVRFFYKIKAALHG